MQRIDSFAEIVNRYDGFLFDAYGVLVNEEGAISGAKRLIERLSEEKLPFWILSNGSSRTESDLLVQYQELGFPLKIDQIVTSGSLLKSYFTKKSYHKARVAVLGTEGSNEYVRRANGQSVDWLNGQDFDLVVIANQTGFPLLEGLDTLISRCFQKIENGESLEIILTNPDLIYPKGDHTFGFTAGALNLLIEEAMVLRYGLEAKNWFIKLGKPFPPMFDEGVRRAGSKRLLMVGDQLVTDIKGAKDYGLDSLLVGTGLTPSKLFGKIPHEHSPTYTMEYLQWEKSV